jgi:8-oxo-dGTP pyrophosphatase MutT (NUDIX family)
LANVDAAVAIVVAQAPVESVLLIRRTTRPDDPWSGHWSLPGGRCDSEDDGPLHSALRELDEECGIRLTREDLVAALPPRQARRRKGPFLQVAPFLFRVPEQVPVVLNPHEAVESRWMVLTELRDPARHGLHTIPGMPSSLLYPAIGLQPMPLWGFTYRLLTDWLGISPPPEAERDLLDKLLAQGQAQETIRVQAVLEYLMAPGHGIPAVSVVEIQPDAVRITGLEFEEYVIRATPAVPAPATPSCPPASSRS